MMYIAEKFFGYRRQETFHPQRCVSGSFIYIYKERGVPECRFRHTPLSIFTYAGSARRQALPAIPSLIYKAFTASWNLANSRSPCALARSEASFPTAVFRLEATPAASLVRAATMAIR